MALSTDLGGADRFSIEDIFFSRTDERGTIRSGNTVFQRASAYEWSELIGAPHKLVRHPDMPKGVFQLFWDRLKANQTVGAYICNMAKDQKPYWVFAVAMPLDDGFLSVRIKPSSDMIEKIVPLYNSLRQAEVKDRVGPQESSEALLAAVNEMGFPDYALFMAHALDMETRSRNTALKRENNDIIDALNAMYETVIKIEDLATEVKRIFHGTHQIPYNMRLQAGRLEASGGPISVISNNHRQMTQELERTLDEFCESAQMGHKALRAAVLQTCVSGILQEMVSNFRSDSNDNMRDKDAEIMRLVTQVDILMNEASKTIEDVTLGVRKFGQKSSDIRRMMSGLELTRIMCKIERSKFDGDHSGLDEVVKRLAIAQDELGRAFDNIDLNVRKTLKAASDINPAQAKVA